MEYFLGVDAGGSKTIGVLVNNEGELVATIRSGPASLVENSEKTVRENIRALKKLWNDLKTPFLLHTCFGLPAFGESSSADVRYREIIVQELGMQPAIMTNDVVVGWAGGTLCQDGVHLVAGTGTIAYGRHGQKEARVSGWGSIIGDEGSAYDLGRETLRRVSRQIDGRDTPTLLAELLFTRLGLSTWQDLVEWVYSSPESERRTKIASVAPITHEAAQKNDPVARAILKEAGKELSCCVKTLVTVLELQKPLVTFSGGVLTRNEIVREHFTTNLQQSIPNVVVQKADLHPALGAILLLHHHLKGFPSERMLTRLKEISLRLFPD